MLDLFRFLFRAEPKQPLVTTDEETLLKVIAKVDKSLLPVKDCEWIICNLATNGCVTFHDRWPEHRMGKEYCRSLAAAKICKYSVDGECVTITLSSRYIGETNVLGNSTSYHGSV